MEDRKKKFTDKALCSFLLVTIICSALIETVIIVQGAMGLAVFLMWVPALAAVIYDVYDHQLFSWNYQRIWETRNQYAAVFHLLYRYPYSTCCHFCP